MTSIVSPTLSLLLSFRESEIDFPKNNKLHFRPDCETSLSLQNLDKPFWLLFLLVLLLLMLLHYFCYCCFVADAVVAPFCLLNVVSRFSKNFCLYDFVLWIMNFYFMVISFLFENFLSCFKVIDVKWLYGVNKTNQIKMKIFEECNNIINFIWWEQVILVRVNKCNEFFKTRDLKSIRDGIAMENCMSCFTLKLKTMNQFHQHFKSNFCTIFLRQKSANVKVTRQKDHFCTKKLLKNIGEIECWNDSQYFT